MGLRREGKVGFRQLPLSSQCTITATDAVFCKPMCLVSSLSLLILHFHSILFYSILNQIRRRAGQCPDGRPRRQARAWNGQHGGPRWPQGHEERLSSNLEMRILTH